MSYLFVTTFNRQGYMIYGKKMLETFLTNWPEDQKILVYVENAKLDNHLQHPRIIVRNLLECNDLVVFKTRHARNHQAHGLWPLGTRVKNFKFDAVRFSHKVYALNHAINNPPFDCNAIIWVDADTITHQKVPEDFLTVNFPLLKDNSPIGLYYLGRQIQYTECGWVVYNLLDPLMKDFWQNWIDLYNTDKLFNYPEWHDSFLFDEVRKEFESKGMLTVNITPYVEFGHPFVNSIIGDYMDHMKGARKKRGRSERDERTYRPSDGITWWKND